MRKLTTLILIIVLALNVKAENKPLGNFDGIVPYIWVNGIIAFCLIDYGSNFQNDAFYISYSVDPKMILIESNYNQRIKFLYDFNDWEPYIMYENAPEPIFYHGVTLGFDRVFFDVFKDRLKLISGVETTTIWNKNPDKWYRFQSYGINAESRFKISDKWSFSLYLNIKTRRLSNKTIVPSGYFGINYKLN